MGGSNEENSTEVPHHKGVRQHIKKNPLIQRAGQMFPVCIFTGNTHLFPSEMSEAALLKRAQSLRVPQQPFLQKAMVTAQHLPQKRLQTLHFLILCKFPT